MGAGVAVDGLPGGEEDVGDVAERSPLSGVGVGADACGDLQGFAAERQADAVLGVAAIDLEAHSGARADVAATALQEEREATEALFDDAPRGAGKVRRGDGGPRAHRDGWQE